MACIIKASLLLCIVAVSVCNGQDSYPLWKVFCSGVPLYRGRLDSIVTPGAAAGHVHKVAGGNHFSAGVLGQSDQELYEVTKAATCTTCSIHTVDNSNYWHPELYYRWPNGTLSLVPDGGLTIYYISRTGDSGVQKTNPNWQPFPRGLRMVAGDPLRRTFNKSNVEHQAVSFVCLTDAGKPRAPETNGFQTDEHFCKNGLRLQVFFPMCWDGKNLDSPNHRSHMSYPTRYNGGDCPASHPVRLPGVFFEAFYAVDKFPHGQGTQPFVLSNGDPTGYGFHGDFVNGWDVDVVREALSHGTCLATVTNNGNSPQNCLPLRPYVKARNDDDCQMRQSIPLTENLGMIEPISRLPGCNPITQTKAVTCTQGFEPRTMSNKGTFHIQSKLTGGYLTYDPKSEVVLANGSTVDPTYRQTWGVGWAPKDLGRTIRNAEINKHFTMQDPLRIRGNSADDWEIFDIIPQARGTYVAIKNKRFNKYLTVNADFTIGGRAENITDAALFKIVLPDGGYAPNGLTLNDIRK